MSPSDLCTLADARAWCGVSGNAQVDDILIGRLISAISRTICGYINRPSVLPRTVTERRDGNSRTRMMLRHWPVSSLSGLSIDGAATPAATPGASPSGWLLDPWDGMPPGRPQSIDLFGYGFGCGRQSVALTYVAGYLVSAEPQTIPADGAITVAAPFGPWASDMGVTLATGAVLTAVATGATPTAGQYALLGDSPGKYQFATADAGHALLISYGFIPFDLYQACAEQVAERYAYKSRIGHVSKSLGGQETMSYSLKDMNDATKMMLNPFRNVVPI